MRITSVLFDLDGTLIDSGPLILSSFQYATKNVLGREIPDDELLAGVGGHGLEEQMRTFDTDRVEELVDVYRDHNLVEYEKVELFSGIREVVEELRERGYVLGVVTVKNRPAVDLTFDLLELKEIFDVVITGDDSIRQKPAPDPLLMALEALNESVDRAVYVGDSPFDIQASHAAGVMSVAVSWGGIHSKEKLLLENPDVIIDAPGEVLDVIS
tara:strand:+ start:386 stop:1024 length:639 start_codon:yes stop_codon:yes gene_type:complete